MQYNLKIGGLDLAVTADLQKDGIVKASVGSESFAARCSRVSDNQIHLEMGDRSLNIFVADGPDGRLINIEGTTYWVRNAEDLARDQSRSRGRREGPREVTPPMPSVVVRILVAPGDRVEKGQGLIVVTAMKMETTLCAPYSGTVVRINASEGDKVMPGQILVDVEEEIETAEAGRNAV